MEHSLTPAELDVVRHVVAGAPNKVIAHRRGSSEETVKVHVKNALRKVGVSNRVALAMWAVRNGVVQ